MTNWLIEVSFDQSGLIFRYTLELHSSLIRGYDMSNFRFRSTLERNIIKRHYNNGGENFIFLFDLT